MVTPNRLLHWGAKRGSELRNEMSKRGRKHGSMNGFHPIVSSLGTIPWLQAMGVKARVNSCDPSPKGVREQEKPLAFTPIAFPIYIIWELWDGIIGLVNYIFFSALGTIPWLQAMGVKARVNSCDPSPKGVREQEKPLAFTPIAFPIYIIWELWDGIIGLVNYIFFQRLGYFYYFGVWYGGVTVWIIWFACKSDDTNRYCGFQRLVSNNGTIFQALGKFLFAI